MTEVAKRYDALVVDRDIDIRMRLKQAMEAVATFGKGHQASSLKEALARLRGGEPIDVVFVSHQFDQEAMQEFVKDAKMTTQGEDAAFVLLVKSREQLNTAIAQNIALGVDGFLSEPYSVDELVEITNIAARVKKERAAGREAIALKFLIKDITRIVDVAAYLKANKRDASGAIAKLRETCAVLRLLQPESIEAYYELAIDRFGRAPLPSVQMSYSGVSRRVRQRVENAVLRSLEETKKTNDEDT
jgi:CheY-like chemotaxis protein